jgi:hypothetical protein
MVRSLLLWPALALALAAAACGDNPTTPAGDTSTPVQITETFVGTVTVNGGSTTPFTVNRAGQVQAQITDLAPDNTVHVGLLLGTWNGNSCAVSIVKDDTALSGAVIGNATGPGTLCIRVYDTGGLAAPTDYAVKVDHF